MKKGKDGANANSSASVQRLKVGTSRREVSPRRPHRADSSINARRPWSRLHQRELEHVIQRYADLYDFAPVGYVSFDRSGRIAEINLTAAELFGLPRERMIGMPFAVFVVREHTTLFLHHLLHCRNSDARVETELRLKNSKREIIQAQLCSTPITASPHNGALLFQTSIVDVTERHRAQARLQQAIEFDEAVMTNMGEGLYTVDDEGSATSMNPAAEKLFGWSFEELRGKKMHDVMHYKHRDGSPFPAHECPGLHVLRKGKSLTNCEDVFIRKDGTFFDVIYSSSPIRKGNKITGLVVVFRDISEQKRAEAAVMRLAAVVRSSHDAVVAKDLNGIITDWNQSAQRIFGYKPKEIIGKSILTLIPQERHFEESEILRRIRSGESIEHYETIRRRKDGRLIDVSLTISPIKDANGKVVGVSKIARDITERRSAERRLAEQARLLDLTNDAIFISDMRDRITFWNRGAKELYGYSAGEALGKVAQKLLCTEFPESIEPVRRKLERNDRWSGELVQRCKGGKKVVVMSRWSLDRDERGKPRSILKTNTDITARKRAEVALQRSKDALEQVVEQRTKELRVANVELKNEIERRKGLEGEILAVSDREQQRLGQELHDGLCQHLTAVAFMARSVALRLRNHRVIDVADIEKIAELVNNAAIDTRNLSTALHRADIDSAGFITALEDLVDREIWKIPCRLEVKPSFHIHDDAAAAQLYRIAREAVINANKHAQAREIAVKLERSRKGMALHVIDDGVGLPDDPKLKKGLGLHIMNYRAQLAGGRLEINSPKTGGTRVSCYLSDNTRRPPRSTEQENVAQRRFHAGLAKALTTLI